jgi:hypothetical protein
VDHHRGEIHPSQVVKLVRSEKGKWVNGLREVFGIQHFLEKFLDLHIGVDELMVVGIGVQFLLNDIQSKVGPLAHRDKPFEEIEDTGAALERVKIVRRARSF